jgi:hypothetical protein
MRFLVVVVQGEELTDVNGCTLTERAQNPSLSCLLGSSGPYSWPVRCRSFIPEQRMIGEEWRELDSLQVMWGSNPPHSTSVLLIGIIEQVLISRCCPFGTSLLFSPACTPRFGAPMWAPQGHPLLSRWSVRRHHYRRPPEDSVSERSLFRLLVWLLSHALFVTWSEQTLDRLL